VYRRSGAAGSRILDGTLHLCVARPYSETGLGRTVSRVRASLAAAEGRLRRADAIAGWFVPSVVLIAAGIWAARLLLHGLAYALSAPGWFRPLPYWQWLALRLQSGRRGGRHCRDRALLGRGLLVGDASALDALARVTTVIMDKTGTLTEGKLTVEELCWNGAPRRTYSAGRESRGPFRAPGGSRH